MKGGRILWLGILVLLTVPVFLRWPTLPGNWSLDEANTGLFAEHVRQGDVLYRDVVDTRTPLLVYLLAAETFVIGHWNLPGQHLVQAVLIGLCALLLWRTLARFGAPGAGAWSAGAFALLQFIYLHPLDAYGITVEWYLVLFSALAFWLLAVVWTGARTWLAFVAGLCFGLSYLAKQPGLLDFICGLVWIALFIAFDPADRRRRLAMLALLIAGFATAVGGSILYFAAHGAWENYRFYAWTYSTRYYLPDVTNAQRWQALHLPVRIAWSAVPIFLGYALAAAAFLLPGLGRSVRQRITGQEVPLLILGWTAAGLLGSGLSGREYGHYCIQLLPGFSLLCGWLCDKSWQLAWRVPDSWFRRVGFSAIALVPLAIGATQAVRRRAAVNLPNDPSRGVSAVVHANTTPTERVFTWGYYPEISYFAQRLSGTRFAYSVFLTGMIPWTNVAYDIDTTYAIIPGAWDQFWQDVERRPPELIVDTGVARSFSKYPLSRQTRLWNYLQTHYVEIDANVTHPLSCRVYRRAGPSLPAATAGERDDRLTLTEEKSGDTPLGVLDADVPAEFDAAELVVGGTRSGAIPLLGEKGHRVTFTYLPSLHGSEPSVTLMARRKDGQVVTGPACQVLNQNSGPSPTLTVGGIEFLPVVKESLARVVWIPEAKVFSANAPARLEYELPMAVRSVSFEYGIFDPAYAPGQKGPTDGVELQVSFQPVGGAVGRLYTRLLDPARSPADRGRQRAVISLPANTPGRLIIVISPGPAGNPSCDWSYITPLTGSVPGAPN